MTAILAWGVVISFLIAWLVFLIAGEKGGSIWIRLGAVSASLVFLLGLWGLVRYGVALVHWLWH